MEKGIRGGVSYIAHRPSEAKNKYMKTYNKDSPSKYIIYLDANNLYGWAMSQPLPTGGFKWSTYSSSCDNLREHIQRYIDGNSPSSRLSDSQSLLDQRAILEWEESRGGRGAFLEVDLEYLKELHDLHNELPLAPEKVIE